jgi:hypothetical protein
MVQWSDTTLEWKPRSLSSIISSYTDENAQDAIGAMVTSKFTYNDGSNSLDINQSNLSLSSIGGSLNVSQINATGTPSSSTVLYGNGTWGTIGSGVQAHGVSILKNYVTQTTSTGSGTTDNITIVNIPANTLGLMVMELK